MIEVRNVVTIKIPFPDINSDLANVPHMYICLEKQAEIKELLKCQTFKNEMIINNVTKNYVCENPNPERNPFNKPTLIDCDKIFKVKNVKIDLSLRTFPIHSICKNLHSQVKEKLENKEHEIHNLDKTELEMLNGRIRSA